MSEPTTIIVERGEDGVATITLNRPDRGNAFTPTMQAELHDAFGELDAEDAVRCIVVTGAGRFFSTGADLDDSDSKFALDSEEAMAEQRHVMGSRIRPWNLRTPIIAAMNGAAVGVGLTFAVQWDIRVMAEHAKFGFVFNRRGVMPEANSLWLLPRLIGGSRALELLLTGRIFRGREAVELGLAAKAVPAEEVLDTALEIARDIAANCAPLSTSITKGLAYEMLGETDREWAYNREWELFRWLGKKADTTEGVQSFLEKRAPEWKLSKNEQLPTIEPTWGE